MEDPARFSGATTDAAAAAEAVAYASWGQRLAAWLLDYLVVMATLLALALVSALVGSLLGIADAGVGEVVMSVVWIFALVAVYTAVILMDAAPYGQTLGKSIVGIRVVGVDGQPVRRGRAVGRFFAKVLSALPLYIGFLWPLWDREKRAFHDVVAKTRVVRAERPGPSLTELVAGPFRRRSSKGDTTPGPAVAGV